MTAKTKTKKTAPAATEWPTKPVAVLTAAPTEADPEMVADIQAHGITEPLYVTPTGDDTYRVADGARRLAAAVAAGMETVPVTLRPVIRTEALAAHPGNVRRDLALSREFLASITQFGIRTPLKITRGTDGALIVGEGNRRLAAAIKLGLSHVPVEYDEVSPADQYADMVTTARHREGLSLAEEASALFQMQELGASAAQMAAAAGVTQKTAKDMVGVATSKAVAVEGIDDLETTMRLAAIEEADPELFAATCEAIAQASYNRKYPVDRAERTLWARAQRAEHRTELDAAGARILTPAELGKKAAPVAQLDDVRRNEDHAQCQGDAWVIEGDDANRYTRYCTNVLTFSHTVRGAVSPDERRRTLTGNAEWDAASATRRQWIAALVSRKHSAAERNKFLAIAVEAQLTGNVVLAKKRGVDKRPVVLAELMGIEPTAEKAASPASRSGRCADAVAAHLTKAAADRRPGYLLADWAACYELEVPRHVWRADYRPSSPDELYTFKAQRRHAVAYLTTLAALGYQPTPIEAAVLADEAYDPHAAASDDE